MNTSSTPSKQANRSRLHNNSRLLKTYPVCVCVTACLIAGMATTSPVSAHQDEQLITEEVVVYGRSLESIGIAQSASEGQVGYDDIALLPKLRVGELVEVVPGLVATQHSGTGKANQYFVRGFNLDHGTDFAVKVDGVPVNLRTHAHGQGYLDLNFIIPELVELANFSKGPYHAERGDFSTAAAVDFQYYDQLDESIISASVGENGFRRALFAGSARFGNESVITLALDTTRYDGPWVLEEDLRQNKAHLSVKSNLLGAAAKLRVDYYDGEWTATDQLPQRAVEQGLVDRLGFIDPDLGGDSHRLAVSTSLDWDNWSASVYFVDYGLNLFSNFTYFLNDPINGDEFEQEDQRQVYGANVNGEIEFDAFGTSVLRWGGEFRYDNIGSIGLFQTTGQTRRETTSLDAVDQWSVGSFVEYERAVSENFRIVAGLRGDYIDFAVDSRIGLGSATGGDAQISPKLALLYQPLEQLELYLNWGQGFHSNDVRGVANLAGDPDPADLFARSDGAEFGIRIEPSRRFNASLVGFWLELDSELVFAGDSAATEVARGTRRLGLESALFWQATSWLAVNASYAYTDARFLGAGDGEGDGEGNEIPNAVPSTFSLGFNATLREGLTATARLRYLDEAPLIENGSIESESSVLVNAGVAWRRRAFEWRVDLFNVLNSRDPDISYFFASRLPGEPAEGVDDVHAHPVEPRTARASLSYRW